MKSGRVHATNPVTTTLVLLLTASAAVPARAQAPEATASGKPLPVRLDQYGDPLPEGAVARLGPRRYPPDGHVRMLAFTANGKSLVGYTYAGVQRWDGASGQRRGRLPVPVPLDASGGMALSADSRTLVTAQTTPRSQGEFEAHLAFWDLQTGKETRRLRLPEEESMGARYVHFCLTADGKHLAVCNMRFGKLLILDLASGRVRTSLGGQNSAFYYHLAAAPDGKTLAAALFAENADGETGYELQLLDIASGKVLRVLYRVPPQRNTRLVVRNLAFSPAGRLLAFALEDQILLTEPATGKKVAEFQAPNMGHSAGLLFTPDGRKLISIGEWDGKIRVWDVAAGKLLRLFGGGGWLSRAIALSPDGQSLAQGSRGNSVVLWDLATGKQRAGQLQGHDSPVGDLAFSPDGKLLASGGGETCLWETAAWQGAGILAGRAGRLAFSYSGKRLAAVDGSTVRLWNVDALRQEHTLALSDQGIVTALAFSRDGLKLLTLDDAPDPARGTRTFTIRHWEVASGKQKQFQSLPAQEIVRKSFLLDGQTMRALLRQGGLGSQPVERLLTDAEDIRLGLSPDARLLTVLAGSRSKPLRILERVTGKDVLALPAKLTSYSAIAWSVDSRLVALGCGEHGQVIGVWDTASSSPLALFSGGRAGVTALAFSPDNAFVAAGLDDGSILIYPLPRPRAFGPPGEGDLEAFWVDLLESEGSKAQRAIAALAAAPARALPLLRTRLKPIEVADAAKVRAWIADLDSPRFAVRQGAARALEKMGGQFEPVLQETLQKDLSLETRRRLEQIRNSLRVPGAATIRTVRAITVLERIGSLEARRILADLAGGAGGALETEEARAALRRLTS
jgi:WD40 repeat protein